MADEIYFWDKQGNPLTPAEADRLLGNFDYKVVAQTEVGPYFVSTVWLGVDHNWWGRGPKILFETAVFLAEAFYADRSDPDRAPMLEFDMRRYATEEEAQQGHDETVTLIRATTQEVPGD